MLRSLILSVVALLSTFTLTSGQNGYRRYSNARFDYSISYPSSLAPQGEADNGDGQKFVTRDGKVEMLVYGTNNALNQTLHGLYEEETASKANRSISYKVLKPDWFVVSGIEGNKIFYQKTLLHNGVFKTFRIEYALEVRQTWDSITVKIGRTFRG